jgi:hypothetical protein
VTHGKLQCLGPSDGSTTGVAWGLGWGLEPEEGTFFHWGDNGAYKAFVIGSLSTRDALVFFLNGASGLAIVPDLVAAFMPGTRPSLSWLGYGRHDSPAWRMLRAARTRGAASVWTEMEAAGLGDDDIVWIARGLGVANLDEDAQWLRERIRQRQVGSTAPQF